MFWRRSSSKAENISIISPPPLVPTLPTHLGHQVAPEPNAGRMISQPQPVHFVSSLLSAAAASILDDHQNTMIGGDGGVVNGLDGPGGVNGAAVPAMVPYPTNVPPSPPSRPPIPPTRPGAPLPNIHAVLANVPRATPFGRPLPAPVFAPIPATIPAPVPTACSVHGPASATSLTAEGRPSRIHQLGPERRMAFFRLDDFQLMRPLGTGTFGRVYLAKYKGAVKYFALKRLRKIDVIRLKQVDHVQNERSLLSRLNHPFIIKMYAALQDERHLYMLMEYAPGGELFHYLRRAGRLSLDAARFYIAELVLAIEYMHVFDIAYRDLKPENLLLDGDGHLKLADFGFAKPVPDVTWTLCGTPEYLAPEIILGHGYGKSVDWWALGVLLYEMLTGSPPFLGDTPTAVYEQTLRGKVYYPPALNEAAREFLAGLLTLDVTLRLGCGEGGATAVKAMAFFAGVNWEAVYQRVYRPPIVPRTGEVGMALNFPPDDSKSSMDVEVPNEMTILNNHGLAFPGFLPA